MSNIGYARVSTLEQNLDMQIAALKKAGCGKIFSEKVSGVKERPALKECLNYLREGDTLVVYKFDRIGRLKPNLLKAKSCPFPATLPINKLQRQNRLTNRDEKIPT